MLRVLFFGLAIAFMLPAQAVEYRDLSYALLPTAIHAKRRLDMRLPSNPVKAPVIVMIHGGGWSIGDKSLDNVSINSTKANMFTAAGYIYVTINYRLSPDVKHPEHVRDVAMALAWVHRNIAQYGGDPNRIYLIGHSAGAHLAALVAIDSRYLKEFGAHTSMLKGVILLDGAGYEITRQMNQMLRFGYLYRRFKDAFTTDATVQANASPVLRIEPKQTIPPFLMLYCSQRSDAREQNDLLSSRLEADGYQAQVVPITGKTHRAINSDVGRKGDPVTVAIRNFLKIDSTTALPPNRTALGRKAQP